MSKIKPIKISILLAILFICNAEITLSQALKDKELIKVLIIDGQNNHDHWPKITFMMKQYLEESGKFTVDVKRTRYTWKGEDFIQQFKIEDIEETKPLPKSEPDPNYRPNFRAYDAVICNFGWQAAPWSDETQQDLENYMKEGGGLVIVHAANNSFPNWPAYNKMIGLGGWGDRNEKDGPYVYYNQEGKLVRDMTPGRAGSHGAQTEFLITLRNKKHPITKGMPKMWMHTRDEIYCKLRGPAENMTVLATAYSPKNDKGTDMNEPMMMTVNFGKGRIFHTALGHADYSVECVGFITYLLRGTQWVSTGKVNIPPPADFPTGSKVSYRKFSLK